MPLSHIEFKDLRNEIEESLAGKTAETVRNSSLKWFGGIFAIMGLGGWAFLNASFERKLDDVSRESRRQLDEQAQLLDAELREARFQLFQIEQSRENIQKIQSEVETMRSESEGALDNIQQTSGKVGFLQEKYEIDVALLLHTRDWLIGQAAAIDQRVKRWEQDGLQVASAGLGSVDTSGDLAWEWGERKIIIMRERPSGDPAVSATEGRDSEQDQWDGVRMLGMSSSLRVALARRGFEVEEWDVGIGKADDEVADLLQSGAEIPSFPHESPALFAHPDFGGAEDVIGDVKAYLEKQHGVIGLSANETEDFAPSERYRASYRALLADDPQFEIDQVAVLYLPLSTRVASP